MKLFSIGTDTEVSLYKDGIYKSAIGRVPGTKDAPCPTEHGWIQQDGVSVEFNTPPVFSHVENPKELFIKSVNLAMKDVLKVASEQDMEVKIVPQAIFFDDELAHPLARIAGCDPDFCVYDLEQNPAPDISATPMRTFGGHIHVGYEDSGSNYDQGFNIVRGLDCTLGMLSLLFDKEGEPRRSLYGKAGAFRPKPYGIEYRTLSNFWIKSDKFIGLVYDTVDFIMNNLDLFEKSANGFFLNRVRVINNPTIASDDTVRSMIGQVPNYINVLKKNEVSLYV